LGSPIETCKDLERQRSDHLFCREGIEHVPPTNAFDIGHCGALVCQKPN
jgi:hypothetical protein